MKIISSASLLLALHYASGYGLRAPNRKMAETNTNVATPGAPTGSPTVVTTEVPTIQPTTAAPTGSPTTVATTGVPTIQPTTAAPTGSPATNATTGVPTIQPTTAAPTGSTTNATTGVPTGSPTAAVPGVPTMQNTTAAPTNAEDLPILDITAEDLPILDITTSSPDGGILPWDWNGDQWNDNLKEMTEFAVSEIPVVGEFISFAVDLFWPGNSQQDMFAQMESQIEFLIGEAITTNNQEVLSAKIEDIQKDMKQYNESLTNATLGQWLNAAIGDCQDALDLVTNLDPDYNYIPWMVQISALHLANLRERYLFGPQIFNVNNPNWKTDLQDAYDTYNTWFTNAYPAWKSDRQSQITGSSYSEGFKVTDRISGKNINICWEETISFNCPGNLAPKPFWSTGTYKDGTINAMRQEVEAQMVSIMEPTWWNFRYLPWMEKQTTPIIPSWGQQAFKLGPYASWGGQIVGTSASLTVLDTPGIVTGALVSWYNSIDYMYLRYVGHNGKHVGGHPGDGNEHNVVLQSMTGSPSSYLQALLINFWYFSSDPIAGSAILYANSDEGTVVESKQGHDGGQGTVNMTMGGDFQIVQLGQINGPGPSGTQGTAAIEASFMYRPVALDNYGS